MAQAQSLAPSGSSPSQDGIVHKDLRHDQVLSKSFAPEPTSADLALINTYAKRPLAADQVYVGEARIANDQIDRDGEKFQPALLEKFAQTLPGKKLLLDHLKKGLGYGRFYGARVATEEGAKWLIGRFYIPVRDRTKEVIEALEDGLADTVSLGFKAKLSRVKGADGKSVVPEYQDGAGAEAMETSIVWLGAQYGAVVKEADTRNPERKVLAMKCFGKEFEITDAPAGFEAHVKESETKLAAAEAEIATAKEHLKALGVEKPEQIEETKAALANGRAYAKEIEEDVVKLAGIVKLCDVTKPEDVEKYRTSLKGMSLEQLKNQRTLITKLVPEKDRLDATADGGKSNGGTKERPVSARAYVS